MRAPEGHTHTRGTTEASSAGSRLPDRAQCTELPNGCRCGAHWSGLSAAHCASCHVTFTGVTAFDRHRRAGRCLIPAEAGLVAKQRAGYVAYGSRHELPEGVHT